jgi:hypothetical protein
MEKINLNHKYQNLLLNNNKNSLKIIYLKLNKIKKIEFIKTIFKTNSQI